MIIVILLMIIVIVIVIVIVLIIITISSQGQPSAFAWCATPRPRSKNPKGSWTCWVLPLTYVYLPKSARAYLFHQSVKVQEGQERQETHTRHMFGPRKTLAAPAPPVQ